MTLPRIEFRVPISPTEGFYAQVRLFNFALRRLGGAYAAARLVIVVGDKCDLDAVRRANRWAEAENIGWERVPNGLFDSAGIWGTANWRLNLPAGDADVVILSDADSVLLRDIDPVIAECMAARATVRGHMAHYPPPVLGSGALAQAGAGFWPGLLADYGAGYDLPWVRHSLDPAGTLPLAPPYFNLGFVAINGAALAGFGHALRQQALEFPVLVLELAQAPSIGQLKAAVLGLSSTAAARCAARSR